MQASSVRCGFVVGSQEGTVVMAFVFIRLGSEVTGILQRVL